MAEEGRYRLAAVRDARERAERGKRSDLAAAVGDAREAQARLETARARTQRARDVLAKAIAAPRPAVVTQLAQAERYILRRRHELDAAIGEELRVEAALDAHQSDVAVARLTLARARADREVIDRHFAQWRETRRKQAERRED